MAESPIGFLEGRRRLPPPQQQTTAAAMAAAESPSSPPPVEGPGTAEESPPLDLHRPGLRGRLEHLRSLAAGNRAPLGSPEKNAPDPNPRPKRSRDSSSEATVVNSLAVTIRTATEWLDWFVAKRTGGEKDFVATASESYAIAAPAAGYILDHIPETGPLAELEDRAGLIGAGACTVSYLGRAMTGRPGGREEDDALKERVVKRLAGAKKRESDARRQAVADLAEEGARQTAAVQAPSRSRMLGFDDEGLEAVGPV